VGKIKQEKENMTTAAVEPSVDLEQAIEHLDEQIGKQRAELAEWEGKQREANSLLAELQSSYAEAAAEVVQGRRAPTEKLAKQIEDLREKLLGFGRVITTKRQQLADLQARLQPLHAEQSQRAQARRIEDEAQLTAQLIAKAERALADKVQAEKVFVETVLALRSHEYFGEQSKRIAMDSAQSLCRRSAGMTP
jgi:hypothetical protein